MNNKSTSGVFVAVAVIILASFLAIIAFYGGLAYVAWHFIAKWW